MFFVYLFAVRMTRLLSQSMVPAGDLNFVIAKFNDLIKYVDINEYF